MTKIIGVVGWKPGENSFGVTIPYIHYFSQFGEVRILIPSKEIQPVDLLILPGGADVDSTKYDQLPGFYNSSPNPFLEAFDKYQLPQYIELNVPTLGICRGMQSLAIFFGGTLDQNIDHPHSEKSRDEEVHSVLRAGAPSFKVNSMHHQAVATVDTTVMSVILRSDAKSGSYIEGIKHRTKPIFGVQYHPEELGDQFTVDLINRLLEEDE